MKNFKLIGSLFLFFAFVSCKKDVQQSEAETWNLLTTGFGSGISDIEFFDSSTGVIVGANGKIMRSTNTGTTWSVVTANTTTNLYDIDCRNNIGIIVGEGGSILRSVDNGMHWFPVSSGIIQDLREIYIENDSTMYALSPFNVLLKSSDVGLTWSNVNTPTSNSLKHIFFKDNSGFISDGLHIFQTTDNGTNWSIIATAPINYSINSVTYRNENEIYFVVSTPESMISTEYYSTTGGQNWDTRTLSFVGYGEQFCSDQNAFYLGQGTGIHIYKTIDCGQSWINRYDFNTDEYRGKIVMINENTGFVILTSGKLLRTMIGG